jgi:DNA-binding NarL/FixJ family response regulator
MTKGSVLLYVDDSESVAVLVKRFFEKRYPTFQVVLAPAADIAWAELQARRDTPGFPKAVISDIRLGGPMDGHALVEKVRAEFPKVRTIVVSAMLSPEDVDRAYEAGAHAVIEKLMSLDQFVAQLFDLIQCPSDTLGKPPCVPA